VPTRTRVIGPEPTKPDNWNLHVNFSKIYVLYLRDFLWKIWEIFFNFNGSIFYELDFQPVLFKWNFIFHDTMPKLLYKVILMMMMLRMPISVTGWSFNLFEIICHWQRLFFEAFKTMVQKSKVKYVYFQLTFKSWIANVKFSYRYIQNWYETLQLNANTFFSN